MLNTADEIESNTINPAESESLPIAFWDQNGRFSRYSTEEVIAKKLNQFSGWSCSAGELGLFIDFDGNVFRGTCEVGGSYGNIFGKFEFPQGKVRCSEKFCMCGGDIMMPKFRTREDVDVDLTQHPSQFRIDAPIAVTGAERTQSSQVVKRVVWSLGRRCNFNCSYCSPLVHSGKEPLKTEEALMTAARNIVDQFCGGHKTIFYIAGGEPTLFPGISRLVKYLYEAGHECVLISNGSARAELYRELINYSHLCFSAHFEFLKETRFVRGLQAMVEVLNKHQVEGNPKYHRVDVKLMTKPGEFKNSEALLEQILSIPGYARHGNIRFNALWLPTDIDTLYPYSEEEIAEFSRLNNDLYQQASFQRSYPAILWKTLREKGLKEALLKLNAIRIYKLQQFKIARSARTQFPARHASRASSSSERWFRILKKPYYVIRHQFVMLPVRGNFLLGHLKKIGIEAWNLFFYARFWRKPYYVIRYQAQRVVSKLER